MLYCFSDDFRKKSTPWFRTTKFGKRRVRIPASPFDTKTVWKVSKDVFAGAGRPVPFGRIRCFPHKRVASVRSLYVAKTVVNNFTAFVKKGSIAMTWHSIDNTVSSAGLRRKSLHVLIFLWPKAYLLFWRFSKKINTLVSYYEIWKASRMNPCVAIRHENHLKSF